MLFKMKMNLYINVVDEYKSKKILNGRRLMLYKLYV
jgi:hypothetical protein